MWLACGITTSGEICATQAVLGIRFTVMGFVSPDRKHFTTIRNNSLSEDFLVVPIANKYLFSPKLVDLNFKYYFFSVLRFLGDCLIPA